MARLPLDHPIAKQYRPTLQGEGGERRLLSPKTYFVEDEHFKRGARPLPVNRGDGYPANDGTEVPKGTGRQARLVREKNAVCVPSFVGQ